MTIVPSIQGIHVCATTWNLQMWLLRLLKIRKAFTTKAFMLPNGKAFSHCNFVSCTILAVIYLLLCPCGDFNIGKTLRPFWKRIYEHVRDTDCGNLDSPLGWHAAFKHDHKKFLVQFVALEHIHPPP